MFQIIILQASGGAAASISRRRIHPILIVDEGHLIGLPWRRKRENQNFITGTATKVCVHSYCLIYIGMIHGGSAGTDWLMTCILTFLQPIYRKLTHARGSRSVQDLTGLWLLKCCACTGSNLSKSVTLVFLLRPVNQYGYIRARMYREQSHH